MSSVGSVALIVGGVSSALAALAHIGIIIGGPSWYRFFGAGERMAQMASVGSWRPAVITSLIALVLFAWSAYALSGAGLIQRLPFLRIFLVLVTAVYSARGIAGFFLAYYAPGSNGAAFWIWSSAVCLVFGVVHAVGVWGRWDYLSGGHA